MELNDVARWHIGNLALAMYGELTAHTLQCAEMTYRARVVPLWALTREALREKATGNRPDASAVERVYRNLYHIFN